MFLHMRFLYTERLYEVRCLYLIYIELILGSGVLSGMWFHSTSARLDLFAFFGSKLTIIGLRESYIHAARTEIHLLGYQYHVW